MDPWIIRAYSDCKVLVEHRGKTYWVRHPYREDALEEARPESPMIAVTRHDWEPLTESCGTFAEVVAFIDRRVKAELEDRRARGIPVRSADEIARGLLRLASPQNGIMDHFLDLLDEEARLDAILKVAAVIREECPWILNDAVRLQRLEAAEARLPPV